jgi:hypothetical protein
VVVAPELVAAQQTTAAILYLAPLQLLVVAEEAIILPVEMAVLVVEVGDQAELLLQQDWATLR